MYSGGSGVSAALSCAGAAAFRRAFRTVRQRTGKCLYALTARDRIQMQFISHSVRCLPGGRRIEKQVKILCDPVTVTGEH